MRIRLAEATKMARLLWVVAKKKLHVMRGYNFDDIAKCGSFLMDDIALPNNEPINKINKRGILNLSRAVH